jgi:hypothetical protein
LDDHPLEDIPYRNDDFALTVMINVLDHVKHALLCMKNLINITTSGGRLIIGQDLTNEEALNALSNDHGLAGHPINIAHNRFVSYFNNGFTPALYKA